MPEASQPSFLVVDRWGRSLCAICQDGILCREGHAYHVMLARDGERTADGKPCRWFEWPRHHRPRDEVIAEFQAYLSSPGCTVERHAWYEKRVYQEALDEVQIALDKLDEVAQKPPGWSIDG